MKNKEHSLFIAYIACLVICIIARIVAAFVPEWSFTAWNRVVVAATVSTVYFCLADMVNQYREMNTLVDLYFLPIQEKNKWLEQWLDSTDEMSFHEKAIKRYKDDLKSIVSEQVTPADESTNEKKRDYVFIWNLIGFSVFLLVMMFDCIFDLVVKIQDILTMIAFVIVLVSAVYKDAILHKTKQQINDLNIQLDKEKLAISLVELFDNKAIKVDEDGKDENADK